MVRVDDIDQMTGDLPEVTAGERYGTRTWNVVGKTFAWERGFSKADIRRFGEESPPEGPILAVRVADLSEKEAVLQGVLKGFFTIPHFEGYPAVLIQLRAALKRDVREILLDGWLACAPTKLAEDYVAQQASSRRR